MAYRDCPKCAAENSLDEICCWSCGYQYFPGLLRADRPRDWSREFGESLQKQSRGFLEEIGKGLAGALDNSKTSLERIAREHSRTAGVERNLGLTHRETVLDRGVHIEETILEVPKVPRLCETLGMRGQRINVDGGCNLYCEVEGHGVPMVLINGGPGGTHHVFHPHFSRARDFAKVMYYDQRGCGLWDYQPGAGYSIDQAVNDLEKLRTALKIERWVVLGWSYGGLLAQCYAIRYSSAVNGLILVAAQPAMGVSLNRTRQYDFLAQEERERIREIYSNSSLYPAQQLFNAHFNGDWKRQGYYRPTTEELAFAALYEWNFDPGFRSCICREVGAVDLAGAFDECPIPTILVEGRWDLTWNTDKPERLSKTVPRARLVMFEKSGHSVFADEPEQFFGLLREFIRALPTSTDVAALGRWKKELLAREERLRNRLPLL